MKKLLIYLHIIIGILSFSSCKKEFSKDEPYTINLKQLLYVDLEPFGIYGLDPENGNKIWENFTFASIKSPDPNIPSQLEFYHPIKFDSFFVFLATADGLRSQTVRPFDLQFYINRTNGEYDFNNQWANIPGVVNINSSASVINIDKGRPIHLKFGDDVIVAYQNCIAKWSPKKADSNNSQRLREVKWVYSDPRNYKTSLAINNIGTSEDKFVFYTAGKTIVAINASTGIERWRVQLQDVDTFRSSICAANSNYLYVGNDNGKMYALNSADGSVFWEYQTNGAILSSPISVGGNIMFGSSDRTFYSVDSATGQLRWKIATGDRVMSSPYYENQKVYFGSNDFNLYAINIIDGTLAWKFLTFGAVTGAPIVHNGLVYFGSHDKNIYALDAETGKQKWHRNVNYIPRDNMILDLIDSTKYSSLSGNYPY